jgi:hypothetical protein
VLHWHKLCKFILDNMLMDIFNTYLYSEKYATNTL